MDASSRSSAITSSRIRRSFGESEKRTFPACRWACDDRVPTSTRKRGMDCVETTQARSARFRPAHTFAARPTKLLERGLRALLEREPETGELLLGVASLDRRFHVELLDEVGVLPDQLARAARQLLPRGLRRL